MKGKIKLYNVSIETQNDRMKTVFKTDKNHRWIDILNKIIKEYNNSTHRATGMTTLNVNKENKEKILESVFKNVTPGFIKNSKFKVGARIIIINKKISFQICIRICQEKIVQSME